MYTTDRFFFMNVSFIQKRVFASYLWYVLLASVPLFALLFIVPLKVHAAPTFTVTALSATVNGNNVTATTTIKSLPAVTAQNAGICARSSSNENVDFPSSTNIRITTSGTTITKNRTFTAGTYTYFACVRVNGVWYNPGTVKTFTVGSPTPTPTATPTATPTPTPTPTPGGTSVLQQWKTALANRETAGTTWLAMGDSITEGQGASARANRWTDITLNTLRNTYPTTGITGGVGYLPGWYAVYAPDSTWKPYTTRTGTVNDVNWYASLGLRGLEITSGSSQTYTVTGSSVDVWYSKSTFGGTFTYKVDNETPVSVNTLGDYIPNSHIIIPFSSAGTHTIVFTSTSGASYIEGLTVYNGDENKGIRFFDASHTGFYSYDYQWQRADMNSLVQYIQPDLVTIMLGANDYLHTAATPAQVKANIQAEIANLRQTLSTKQPSIVVGLYYGLNNSGPNGSGYTWDQYETAIRSVVTEDPTLGLLDFSSMGNAVPGGQWSSDGLHASDTGNTTMSNIATQYLTTQ